MKSLLKFIFFISITSFFFSNCTSEKSKKINSKKDNSFIEVKYAKGFKINILEDSKELIIKSPYPNSKETFTFVLKAKNRERKPRKSMNLLTYIKKETVISTVKGLNLKINKEPVQLACFISDRTQEQQRKIRSHYWRTMELIGHDALTFFRNCPLRIRMRDGVRGVEVRYLWLLDLCVYISQRSLHPLFCEYTKSNSSKITH